MRKITSLVALKKHQAQRFNYLIPEPNDLCELFLLLLARKQKHHIEAQSQTFGAAVRAIHPIADTPAKAYRLTA